MKTITVIGARPQFIKAAVVSRAFSKIADKNKVQEIIVHTGQHYDDNMSTIFFNQMHIPEPDYWLEIGSSSHGQMTGRMLEKIEKVLQKEKPDVVIVYGDTNSTLAGALAAVKLHIPVAHVEAGLRSFNMYMPEEINRILTDQVSSILFCPTETALRNLQNEGVNKKKNVAIYQVGDVMYDAMLYYRKIATPSTDIENWITKNKKKGFYLATIHRAQNTDNRKHLYGIMEALQEIALKIPIILPIHPRTRGELRKEFPQIHIIDPVGYFDMISLLSECRGVFTDSGGLQKEAYFCNKPCITLREETEWVELVSAGMNVLAGSDPQQILTAEAKLAKMKSSKQEHLYGEGDAGEKIVRILAETVG